MEYSSKKISNFLRWLIISISVIGIVVSLTGSCGGIANIFQMKCGRAYIILSACWMIILAITIIENKISHYVYKKILILVRTLFPVIILLIMSGGVSFIKICKNSHMRCHTTMPIELTLAIIVLLVAIAKLYIDKKMEEK